MANIPTGTRMTFIAAIPPKGWRLVRRERRYIVCEYCPDGVEVHSVYQDEGLEKAVFKSG